MKTRREFLKWMGTASAAVAVPTSMARASESPSAGASISGRRNVILIVSDEHQANTCGCYGSAVRRVDGESPTPFIDQLAADGVRFDSMYCPSPLCAPSRAAYMTGMYPHTTTSLHHKMQAREAGLTRFPGVLEGMRGMGEYFRAAGYSTAAFGKMHVHGEEFRGWDLGFDERDTRIYTKGPGMHYADLRDGDINKRYREIPPYVNQAYHDIDAEKFAHAPEDLTVRRNAVNEHFLETLVEAKEEMFDEIVTEQSIDFIRRKSNAGDPFMIHVGLEKPHRPWTVHQEFLDRFDPDDMPLPETIAEWEDKGMHPFVQAWSHTGHKGEGVRNSTAAYYACAAQIDDCVGRILAACEELGILDDTVIVYTSDHGENLYEHGLIEKHNMLDPAARVPFVIRAPWAMQAGSVSVAPANLIDMLPTICELTSVDGDDGFEGASLVPAMTGREDTSRMVFSEFYQAGSSTRGDEYLPVRMGLVADYKYVYTHAAADQLYDRHTMGEERDENLAFEAEHEARTSHMRLCTLDGWELDEYPMITGRAHVVEGNVHLSWESGGTGMLYDVYRGSTPDVRLAERIAAGVTGRSWIDETATSGQMPTYWIVGHHHLDEPYVDPRGNARFGDEPIVSTEYPRVLPVTRPMLVEVVDGFAEEFAYEPLLGCAFGGLDWIHIGHKPVTAGDGAMMRGPVTVLSPHAVSGDAHIAADVKTPRPGHGELDFVQVLFGYRNMEQYYAVVLRRNGEVVLTRREGEWRRVTLASAYVDGLRPGDWNFVEATLRGNDITVRVNGIEVMTAVDENPYSGGRVGFDVPLHVREAMVRTVSAEV